MKTANSPSLISSLLHVVSLPIIAVVFFLIGLGLATIVRYPTPTEVRNADRIRKIETRVTRIEPLYKEASHER